jgi:hypothetical protein
MTVEIVTEAAQFLFWEYINSNFFAVLVELLGCELLGIPAAAAAAGITLNICNRQSSLLSNMAAKSLLQ